MMILLPYRLHFSEEQLNSVVAHAANFDVRLRNPFSRVAPKKVPLEVLQEAFPAEYAGTRPTLRNRELIIAIIQLELSI